MVESGLNRVYGFLNVGRSLSLQLYDYAFEYVEGSKHVCGCSSLMLKLDSLCVRLST